MRLFPTSSANLIKYLPVTFALLAANLLPVYN